MRLTALCLVGALLAALLRRTGGEMALLLALAVCGAAVMLLAQPHLLRPGDAPHTAPPSINENTGMLPSEKQHPRIFFSENKSPVAGQHLSGDEICLG